VRLALHDEAATAVDEVGAPAPGAVPDDHLRLQVEPLDVRADGPGDRFERVGGQVRGLPGHAPRLCSSAAKHAGRELDQPNLGDAPVAERRVGDRERLVERQRPQAVDQSAFHGRDALVHLVRREVGPVRRHALPLVLGEVPLGPHRHVRQVGDGLDLPAVEQRGAPMGHHTTQPVRGPPGDVGDRQCVTASSVAHEVAATQRSVQLAALDDPQECPPRCHTTHAMENLVDAHGPILAAGSGSRIRVSTALRDRTGNRAYARTPTGEHACFRRRARSAAS